MNEKTPTTPVAPESFMTQDEKDVIMGLFMRYHSEKHHNNLNATGYLGTFLRELDYQAWSLSHPE